MSDKSEPVSGEVVKKHAGGRPLLYKTPEEMQVKIDEYFEYCDNGFRTIEETNAKGETVVKQVPWRTPYTISGLAETLGMDRGTLLDYSKRDKFYLTIKAARIKVERSVEERLLSSTGVVAGQIFWLKNNASWKDKTEQDVNVRTPQPILGSASVKKDIEE